MRDCVYISRIADGKGWRFGCGDNLAVDRSYIMDNWNIVRCVLCDVLVRHMRRKEAQVQKMRMLRWICEVTKLDIIRK